MPHNRSTVKRLKQSRVRRMRNKSRKSEIKTCIKSFDDALKVKDRTKAGSLLQDIVKMMDTASRKGILHINTVARKKSQLQKQLNNA
jgi:small subunit ribosomal protein S20